MRAFAVEIGRMQAAHDRDVSRALMTATLARTKEPVAVAKKLYVRPRAPLRRQTAAEARAIVTLLAAQFGWQKEPPPPPEP